MRIGRILESGEESIAFILENGVKALKISQCTEIFLNEIFISINIEINAWKIIYFLAEALRKNGIDLIDFFNKLYDKIYDEDELSLDVSQYVIESFIILPPTKGSSFILGLVENSPSFVRNHKSRYHMRRLIQAHHRPETTLIANQDNLTLPNYLASFGGWNPELAVIIGRKMYRVPQSEILNYILGYTIILDISFYHFRQKFPPKSKANWWQDASGAWLDKCIKGMQPVGPWITSVDEVSNPYNLMIHAYHNNKLVDRAHTGSMIIGIEEALHWLSYRRELFPGDLISFGAMGIDGLSLISLSDSCNITGVIEKLGSLSINVSAQNNNNENLGSEEYFTNTQWICHSSNDQVINSTYKKYPPIIFNAPYQKIRLSPSSITKAIKDGSNLIINLELASYIRSDFYFNDTERGDIAQYFLCLVIKQKEEFYGIAPPSTPQEEFILDHYSTWLGVDIIRNTFNVNIHEWLSFNEVSVEIQELGIVIKHKPKPLKYDLREIIDHLSSGISLVPGDLIRLGSVSPEILLNNQDLLGKSALSIFVYTDKEKLISSKINLEFI